MTNKEYLDALANDDPAKLAQWFGQEWTDCRAIRAEVDRLNSEVSKLRAKLGKMMEVLP